MVSKRQQEAAVARAKQSLDKHDDSLSALKDILPNTADPLQPNSKQEVHADADIVDAVRAGERIKTVNVFGHQVTFKALNTKEELVALRLAKPMMDTDGHDLALQLAYFSQSVQQIDGEQFYTPIAQLGDEATARYSLAMSYYRTFINKFFEEFTKFRTETDEELEKLGKG